MQGLRIISLWFYGVAVIASGVYRIVSEAGGEKALIFGLVMGGLAMGAGLALGRNKPMASYIMALVALIFVGSWFFYEAIILAKYDVRQIVILALTAAQAVILFLPSRK